MGVYGLPWTQLGHRYRYHGIAVLFRYLKVLFRYFSVLNGTFSVLNSTFLVLLGLGSIHNTYNVPSEPERAAKARRAVVASIIIKMVRMGFCTRLASTY